MNQIDAGGLHVLPLSGEPSRIGVTIRAEGDPAAVRRPTRPEVSRAAVGEVLVFAAGEIEQPEIGEAFTRVEMKARLLPSGEREP